MERFEPLVVLTPLSPPRFPQTVDTDGITVEAVKLIAAIAEPAVRTWAKLTNISANSPLK